jgi:hypothetical protein
MKTELGPWPPEPFPPVPPVVPVMFMSDDFLQLPDIRRIAEKKIAPRNILFRKITFFMMSLFLFRPIKQRIVLNSSNRRSEYVCDEIYKKTLQLAL